MNLKHLSDEKILSETKKLVKVEGDTTLLILHHLREVEHRRLFASLGYPSLFEYCQGELKYCGGSAQRRIASMRLLKDLPEIEEKISEGKLSLTVLAQAQSFFRRENCSPEKKREVVAALEDKSALQAQRELLKHASDPEKHLPEKTRPVSESHMEMKIVVENELMQEIEALRGLLAHSHPGMTLREAIEFSVKLALEKHRPKKPTEKDFEKAQSAPSLPPEEVASPYIPAPTQRIVWHRDEGCCTFVDPVSGRRCRSKHRIQYDHIHPRALGGRTTPENLRLLCFHHNHWEAQRFFGPWASAYPISNPVRA